MSGSTVVSDRTLGLTSTEARSRLAAFGPNEIRERETSLWLAFFAKLWAPVPWMLEVTILLELLLDKRFEAAIIAALLLFNAALSLVQERRASNALALLRRRLSVNARVLRDGAWQTIPARELVPGDFVHLRMGDLVPADLQLREGLVQIDQSVLTGESVPIDVAPRAVAYAGATITRGEASGEVTGTAEHTFFGRTAQLVRAAKTASHVEDLIFTIVKYMVALDGALVVVLFAYSVAAGVRLAEVVPFALILLVASVPVALPATFAVATALGALELGARGVLTTHAAAIEEAAAMDVLCSDKTGTITENRLTLSALYPYLPFTREDLLRFAALASDEATQDPIDLAILARRLPDPTAPERSRRVKLVPFDPATKLAEAIVADGSAEIRVVKGAPRAVAARLGLAPERFDSDVEAMAAKGLRVLAVGAGTDGALRPVGLLGLDDPPRPDSAKLIRALVDLGVRVVIVTGDGLATARAVASQVGVGTRICPAADLRRERTGRLLEHDVFAEVLPQDKFRLIRKLQAAGHVVGMTGDGVNDAPALKQAEVGIAVANATDVAKASASLVLTNPGLADIVSAVETSRRIHQRMLTYTLNKIVKTVEIGFFLTVGVILTGQFIITPSLIVLLLFTNDFLTMSIATDNVSFSSRPDRWQVRALMRSGLILGGSILLLSLGIFFFGRNSLHLPLPELQTMVFVTLVFTGQGTVYLVRERRHLWDSRPSRWLLGASACDLCLVFFLAARGILMAPLSPVLIASVLAVCIGFLVVLDFAKSRLLCGLDQTAA